MGRVLKTESCTEVIEAARVCVAETSDEVVGLGQFNADTGKVEATYVLPEAQRSRIGCRLLREAESRAQMSGVESIPALRFTERTIVLRGRRVCPCSRRILGSWQCIDQ